ncbi:MAG: FkbM family methyltransferase [Mucilaginibacter polytrichastri]|nr:FkbM family methyltransferase [Mucilaginibacter polytrichastri]
MSAFSQLLRLLADPRKLRSLLSFSEKGYLAQIGWFTAFDKKSPVAADGSPIPWVTYSFIDFIRERIRKDHRIFEFGSGNSTLFYAKLAGKVVAVEHDRPWFDRINAGKAENAELLFVELEKDGAYCRTPLGREEKFDIIIVDGRDRVNCCIQAVNAISENGVIVLDDSERDFYRPAIDFLGEKGFRHLPFSGISPGLFYHKSTSIFYRDKNCLGI